jgi:hypothetical protein
LFYLYLLAIFSLAPYRFTWAGWMLLRSGNTKFSSQIQSQDGATTI